MRGFIRRLLTRQILTGGEETRKVKMREVPPSERLVLITYFSIAAIAALTIVQTVHLVVLRSWNSEVFAAITGLIGTVSGILIGSKT